MASLRSNGQKLSRRALLLDAGGAALLATVASTGCEVLSTDPEGRERARNDTPKGKEAPQLARRVKTGDLLPVEERLPRNPVTVAPTDRIGGYGGEWNSVLLNAADYAWLDRTIGYEQLLRWAPDGSVVIPNIAESVESSDDGLEYTITLREGMKWSDGEPFTADDLAFAWDDVLANKELTPVMPAFMLSGSEPGVLRKVGDHEVRVTFGQPHGLFMSYLAFAARQLVESPRHYLEKFHADYNPDIDSVVEEHDFATWVQLFHGMADLWANKDLPRHHAWTLSAALGDGSQVTAERNPYYFKVDPDGSQLPYIDRVAFDVISDTEVIVLKATNGDLDFHARHINTLSNKPVLARNRDQGGYHFSTLRTTLSTDMVIAVNLTHEDPVKREIFQNRDFRIGLSYAINREELKNAVFQRQGEPHQAAPVRGSEFHDREFASQYTDHDVSKANEHLDAAGYAERDDDGFRLGPNGRRISFQVEVPTPAFIPIWPDAMQLVVGYWRSVGVDGRLKTEDRSLYEARIVANKPDATVWPGEGGLLMEFLDPRWYFPYSIRSTYAIPWAQWFETRGGSGQEPPPAPRQQMELFWILTKEPDEEQRKILFRKILQIAKEEFYVIGTIYYPENYCIVRDDFHNVPRSIPEWWGFSTPALTNPEQFFIET